MSSTSARTCPARHELAQDQPEITVVNIDAETGPRIIRTSHTNVSDPRVLVALPRFLEGEDAQVISLAVSPTHLALVAALKDGWAERFRTAVYDGQSE